MLPAVAKGRTVRLVCCNDLKVGRPAINAGAIQGTMQ
jgi:hypothetical protein